jgi:ABC-type nitrate/sulfonate/bicarbonate transport system substrate-binding protein
MYKRFALMAAAAALAAAAFVGPSASAADKIRVMKSGDSITFAAIEIGQAAGIWKDLDLDISLSSVTGTRLEQAFVAGEVDIGLGAGTSMAYRLKGVPDIGVAAIAGPPYSFVLAVGGDSPIRSVDELKGKPVGVTSAGSVTDWMVRELSRQKGWGPDGINVIIAGNQRSRMAGLVRGDLAAAVMTSMAAYEAEANGRARIIASFGDIAPHFHTHMILASDDFVAKHADLLKRFLKGWFRSVAYMKAHKPEAIRITSELFKISPEVMAKAYDEEMRMISDDGAFDPKAVVAIRRSFVELGILDKEPPAEALYTTRFVPVTP